MEREMKIHQLIDEAHDVLFRYVMTKDKSELARYNELIKEIKEKYGDEEKEKTAGRI